MTEPAPVGAATETDASDPTRTAVGRPERTGRRVEVARPTKAGRNGAMTHRATVPGGAHAAGAARPTAIDRRAMGPGALASVTVRPSDATTAPEVEGAGPLRSAAVPG